MAKLILRPATPSDLMAISKIEVEAAKYEGRKEPLGFSVSEMYAIWQQRMRNHNYIMVVACIEHHIQEYSEQVGFVALDLYTHEYPLVQAIYIAPAYMHKGIGTALMHRAEHIVKHKNFKYLQLFLEPQNNIGFKFYSGLGFNKTKLKYRHLHIMVKEL